MEDIDRVFEAHHGVLVFRNTVATQLHRPEEYIRMDEEIAKGVGKEAVEEVGMGDEKAGGVGVERV